MRHISKIDGRYIGKVFDDEWRIHKRPGKQGYRADCGGASIYGKKLSDIDAQLEEMVVVKSKARSKAIMDAMTPEGLHVIGYRG